ncbi:MAG: RluA family pseudouridine synthase [Flavobacteriales bacterium AspAUS03]
MNDEIDLKSLESLSEPEIQDPLYEYFRFVADKNQTPLRVDRFLMNFIENTTRNKIQNAAKAGNIRVNSEVVKSNHRVKALDTVQVLMTHPPRLHELVAEDIPLDIVYEDEDLIVVNKPARMVVHPGHGNYTNTLVNALKYHFEHLPSLNNDLDRPGLMHRIDKDTSGLLVVAKNEYSLKDLARQFFSRSTQRRYIALVWGDLPQEQGTIIGYIGRSLRDRKQMDVFPDGEYGKYAVTHYEVLERFRYVSLVACRLETGRTHQIRAHFKYLGHPLFNDARYGGDKILRGVVFSKYRQFIENCFEQLPRQALHAQSLSFIHPVSKKTLYFESPIPEDMHRVFEKWRTYVYGGTS